MIPSYRQTVAVGGAVFSGAITAWSLLTGYPLPLVAPSFVGTAYFVGMAIPTVYEAVPEYEQIGFAVIGAVSAISIALGYRREFLFALAFFGAVAVLDLAIRHVRESRA